MTKLYTIKCGLENFIHSIKKNMLVGKLYNVLVVNAVVKVLSDFKFLCNHNTWLINCGHLEACKLVALNTRVKVS